MFKLSTVLFFLYLAFPAAAQRYVATPNEFAQWTSDWEDNLAGPQLSQALRSFAEKNPEDLKSPVVAVSCSSPPALKIYLDSGPLKAEPAVKEALLHERAENLVDVIKVIRSTPTGNQLLNRFMPKYGYTFSIQQITPEVQSKLRSQKPVALYQPSQKALYFDKSQPIGRVAFILLHEIVHCLDNDANHAYQKIMVQHEAFHKLAEKTVLHTARRLRKNKKELAINDFNEKDLTPLLTLKRTIDQMTQVRSFRTERLAYDASYQVWKELAALYPGYYSKETGGRGVSALSPIAVSDSHLVSLMRFNPATIERYQAGRCRLPQSSRAPSLDHP